MEWVLFAVLGLAAGVAYGGLGVAIVATKRGTGVVNLAQGAVAMWGAYVYQAMRDTGTLHLPVLGIPHTIATGGPAGAPVAITAGVLSSVALSLMAYALVFRPLRHAPPLAGVVASIGITTVIQSIVTIQFGTGQIIVRSWLGTDTVTIAGQTVPVDRIQSLLVFGLVVAAVWAYLRFARQGSALAAYADNTRAVTLMGYSADLLALRAWTLAGLIAGIVGVTVAPLVPLNPITMTLFIVPALAAALLARFRSVIVVAVAGLGIGVLQTLLTYLKTMPWYPSWLQVGAEDLIPFVLIIGVLVFAPASLGGRGGPVAGRLPAVLRPTSARGPVLVVVVATGIAIALFDGVYRFAFTQSLIAALLVLSVVILTGYAGQISIAPVAIAGAAGLLVARLTIDAGLPFPVAAVIAIGIAAALGMLVALPALRAVGIQLTVVTLALSVAAQTVLFSNPVLNPAALGPLPAPRLFGLDVSVRQGPDLARVPFILLCAALLIVALVVLSRAAGGRTGVRLLSVRSNERAAASVGVGIVETKALVFALSSVLAAVAGVLMTYSVGQFSSAAFDVLSVALPLLAFAYLSGITSLTGALVGALMVPGGVTYVLVSGWFQDPGSWYLLFSGCVLILTAILNPEGIAGATAKLVAGRRVPRRRRPPADRRVDTVEATDRVEVTHG